MLMAINESPGVTSAELAGELDAEAAQISRSGTALIERGLVVKTRHGRERRWRLTPRGDVAVAELRRRTGSQREADTHS
ncbi:winged helix DNA-binding protein [Streptomyces pseudogriseolus]|uniref:winged helix DNA-binding protein n=1 Tax=Streptomyces pseudogriseolus TaxID=36817 RepID=UPI000996DE3A